MLNKVVLIGRLGADPEIRYMQNGDAIATVNAATSRKWKDKATGERKEETEWHRIVMYGHLGKIAGDYLKKGSSAYFEGRIKTESWEKDGEKKFRTVIIAEDMKMLDGKQSGGQQSGSQDAQPKQKERDVYSEAFDDDIPFASLNGLIRNHLV